MNITRNVKCALAGGLAAAAIFGSAGVAFAMPAMPPSATSQNARGQIELSSPVELRGDTGEPSGTFLQPGRHAFTERDDDNRFRVGDGWIDADEDRDAVRGFYLF
ncbi:hypothetical protein [Streptomyces sp. NPDC086023]|uniref:hypothetical protein n=1 Tax=Streptomyces sp. NPDC086023 TaxID=3365746 RepID=UPI0037D17940